MFCVTRHQAGFELAKLGSAFAVKLTINLARRSISPCWTRACRTYLPTVSLQFNGISNSARIMVLMTLVGLLMPVAVKIVIYRRYFKSASMPARLPATGMRVSGSAPVDSTLPTFVSVMGLAITDVAGVPRPRPWLSCKRSTAVAWTHLTARPRLRGPMRPAC